MGPSCIINPSIFDKSQRIKYYCRYIFVCRTILYFKRPISTIKFESRQSAIVACCLYINEPHSQSFFSITSMAINNRHFGLMFGISVVYLAECLTWQISAIIVYHYRVYCTLLAFLQYELETTKRNHCKFHTYWNTSKYSVDWSNIKCLVHHIIFYRSCFHYNTHTQMV